ncbi:hypothetical protein K8P03_10845 [Anaerococcus murdochii]|uniref:Cadherin domain-containing protein n=1 Tax=Anaerococcus murdochii TaxID=411577 RepID=A0ABS7T1V1_9FIRM|nr:hypothetical protein [Anaerococcus murdochii]MBZ2387769.1 hypothetical protein [Anaerococcus murdochii]
MASLHQWKKYNIAYDYTYKIEYGPLNTNDYYDITVEPEGDRYLTAIDINKKTGKFILSQYDLKYLHEIKVGDKIYAIKSPNERNTFFTKADNTRYWDYVEDNVYEFTRLSKEPSSYLWSKYGYVDKGRPVKSVVDTKTPKRGSYIGVVSGGVGAYPQNGQKDGYWYVYDKELNSNPAISGSDLDLGSKDSDFTIDYVVSDSDGDVVSVDILVDDVVKVEGKSVPLGVNQKYLVSLDDFSLGDHKIEIRARDSKGAEAPSRTYYFSKANTAPKISGSDSDLGSKSTGFTVSYRVDDKDSDPVSVRISLDDKEMASISDAQGKDLRFTLDEAKVRELEIGKTYTITIKADDGKGGVAYRRYSFTKVNTPPIISGVDSDLGKVKNPVTIKFSVSDVEKDKIYFSLLLDGKEVMSQEGAEDGKEYSYKINHDTFISLTYGKHELKLLAWDDENVDKKAIRKFTFERISGGLDVEFKLAEYDTQPKKIVAVPHGDFIDAKTFQVLACNNYLDAKPTWEDITNMSKIARAFSFTNATKTAGKWALGVRVIIENGPADVSSVLRGIKGGIE